MSHFDRRLISHTADLTEVVTIVNNSDLIRRLRHNGGKRITYALRACRYGIKAHVYIGIICR